MAAIAGVAQLLGTDDADVQADAQEVEDEPEPEEVEEDPKPVRQIRLGPLPLPPSPPKSSVVSSRSYSSPGRGLSAMLCWRRDLTSLPPEEPARASKSRERHVFVSLAIPFLWLQRFVGGEKGECSFAAISFQIGLGCDARQRYEQEI